ncbi:MAG: PIG-L family deacetylase [Candidatus Aureabacteria bacterium]|nr:PIG-L family deacetylase [Candidatus Auribacterota bacterium]
MKNKILIVAAHPDDEILGCGGTITRLVKEGHEAYTLILGEGITSRDETRDIRKRKREIEKLKNEVAEANQIIGVRKIFTHDLPDNRFDTVPFLDIVKIIENIKNQIKPSIIFTHFKDDLNIDHQITNKAVITSTRPLKDEPVKTIYAFEILSSTEWNFSESFSSDVFFDISEVLPTKLMALKKYTNELRKFPFPRSLEGIELNAKNWGMKIGVAYAEAFKLIRTIV